ncbi:polysaccharide biosynthesis tyrosine autokinase [Modestobacter marinus]|uniref:non-specific protein-tyrosine kinase n=1 Tax=Modestobacter marinus TaxID=477641 RepID=A0A846LDZ6_9ACTN|nr:polysaccharide biosynthesis tyrosine autokinase [Modestobacter marinus]NIH65926.1 capsular exopolysaccharide synthesis family protein [Modestobacter marinus]GGL68138.1 chromosome partitioning protein [Modestobacter marinus]
MELGELMAVLRRRWRWATAAALVGLLAGLAWALTTAPTYRSTASVYFSLQYGDTASDLVQGSTFTQNQVTSYAELATTPAVLQPVIDELGLPMGVSALAGRVQASAPVDTVIVEVAVTDTSAVRSARIADAVVDTLSRTVEELAPEDADGEPTVQATTVAPAEVPVRPAAPNTTLYALAGLVAGLVLGCALLLLRAALDTRVRDTGTLAALTDRPLIGTIGAVRTKGTERPVVVEADPHAPQAESFRQLRTNLQFLSLPGVRTDGAGGRVLLVTSAVAAEGKSTVSANLAAALAETGARVLLVDADLRRPSLDGVLGIEGSVGLTSVLLGHAAVADVAQDWGSSGLQVLAAGPLPPNPTELLGSPAMAAVLDQLRGTYDHVVLDSAPLLPVADGAVLSRVADGVVLVVNAVRARRAQVTESLQVLETVRATVLGVVLNQVERKEQAYDYRPRHGVAGSAPTRVPAPVLAAPTAGSAGLRGRP